MRKKRGNMQMNMNKMEKKMETDTAKCRKDLKQGVQL